MTPDQIKARMTTAMEEIYNDDLCFEGQAAAVMALVGPKPLVWEAPCAGFYRATVRCGCYEVYGQDGDWWAMIGGEVRHISKGNRNATEAQAAAQAHADASHWANTQIGHLIGGDA